MTKADIVHAVYTRLGGFSKKESADLVDLVFETMKETLGRGEKIKISGFGNFVLRDKRQRQGRNPQTGEPSGFLKEAPAMALINAVVPKPTRDEPRRAIQGAIEVALRAQPG